jgi:hypothetical protein
MWQVWERLEELNTKCLLGKLKGKYHLKDLGIDGRIFRERGGMVYTGFE